MLTLSGCATKTGSGEKTDVSALLFCDGAKPITWSAKDTDGTLIEECAAKGRTTPGIPDAIWDILEGKDDEVDENLDDD